MDLRCQWGMVGACQSRTAPVGAFGKVSCKARRLRVSSLERMKACLNFGDILEVGRPQVEEMQRIGDSFTIAEVPGACEAFTRQVTIVEATLVNTYGIAAAMARKAEDLNDVADIWRGMSEFCRTALAKLATLKHKYPYCGTPALYDKALDY